MKELISINWTFCAAAGMVLKDSLQSQLVCPQRDRSPSALTHADSLCLHLCSLTGLSRFCVDVLDFCQFRTCTGFRACPDVQPALFSADISFIMLIIAARRWNFQPRTLCLTPLSHRLNVHFPISPSTIWLLPNCRSLVKGITYI